MTVVLGRFHTFHKHKQLQHYIEQPQQPENVIPGAKNQPQSCKHGCHITPATLLHGAQEKYTFSYYFSIYSGILALLRDCFSG